MRVLTVLFLVLMGLASPAHAWWDMGHMEVAAIAYGRLDDAVRPKVDAPDQTASGVSTMDQGPRRPTRQRQSSGSFRACSHLGRRHQDHAVLQRSVPLAAAIFMTATVG